jgi:hypothetical protein
MANVQVSGLKLSEAVGVGTLVFIDARLPCLMVARTKLEIKRLIEGEMVMKNNENLRSVTGGKK